MLTAVVLLAPLAGCATAGAPVRLDPPFWSRSGERIHVVATEPLRVRLYRTGGDDLYHEVVSDARDADMIEFLEDYHRSATTDGTEKLFSGLLKERGFVTSFSKIDRTEDDADDSWDDPHLRFAKLRQRLNEHVALVVSTSSWYFTRDYAGVVPTGSHRVRVNISGELVDLVKNQRLWRDEASGNAEVPRKWNEPPDQPKLRQALETARAEAEGQLAAKLRSWNGTFTVTGFSRHERN